MAAKCCWPRHAGLGRCRCSIHFHGMTRDLLLPVLFVAALRRQRLRLAWQRNAGRAHAGAAPPCSGTGSAAGAKSGGRSAAAGCARCASGCRSLKPQTDARLDARRDRQSRPTRGVQRKIRRHPKLLGKPKRSAQSRPAAMPRAHKVRGLERKDRRAPALRQGLRSRASSCPPRRPASAPRRAAHRSMKDSRPEPIQQRDAPLIAVCRRNAPPVLRARRSRSASALASRSRSRKPFRILLDKHAERAEPAHRIGSAPSRRFGLDHILEAREQRHTAEHDAEKARFRHHRERRRRVRRQSSLSNSMRTRSRESREAVARGDAGVQSGRDRARPRHTRRESGRSAGCADSLRRCALPDRR